MFQPTALQQQIHEAIGHRDHKEKDLRCFVADLAPRRAMTTVLGPAAINKSKFTDWSENGRMLTLLWDTRNGVVTTPREKIEKTQEMVIGVLAARAATKTTLLQLLGSLRHVMTCCPPARSFNQRRYVTASSLTRHGVLKLGCPAIEDLKWMRTILLLHKRFNGTPVDHFASVGTTSVHVHTNASDDGLCVLEPRIRQFIRVPFTKAMPRKCAEDKSINSIRA
ncbi:hypothetical protein PC118_g15988 [Phytophthora cactorum]|uniref:Uncharacterized protein n=2 Tax=Phytophthora cactorum TaxID=29920 RepID=A0A8T1FHK0_9STRA|nr:hypothetical protein PC118_g15988 [Phytophthora cactorum]